VNQLPVANFTYLPLNPLTSDLVQFSDASTDPDGTISSWLWSFGDGSISNNKNPTHHYADDGTYLVKLNITDNDGGKKAISKSITISNVPPHVNFTYLPANPLTSDTIHFNDASSDGDGTIVSWYWRFGDDGSSLSQNPSHKYSDNGVYPVTLNVTDDDGALTSKSLSISVMNVPPKANFSYQPSNPLTTDSIQFMDTSTDADGSIIAWSWSFGDGSTSTQRNPVHMYSDDGNYTVLLNVTDDDGEKNTKTRFLSVRNVPPIASFDFEPFNPMTYETVFFNSTSFEPDGVILNYTWDFGDGNHSYTRKTTHHYTEDRTYFIQLNVTDDDGDTDTIQDTILVSPNYPPNIPGTPAPTNGSNNIQLSATLGWNGGDPNSDTVTYDVYFDTANPPNKVKSNQTLTNYNPGTLNFTTTYYWKIIAWDSHGESKTSPTWHFTTRANHPPNAVPDSYNINEDSVLYVTAPGVLGNDGDPDGDIMTVVKVSETTPGSITVNGSGSFRYVPSANYYGADTFTYKVFDGFLYSAVVNVTITIHPVNDPPVLGISSPGNGSIVNRLSLTWGIPLSDVEGDQISWTIQCSNGQRTNSTGEDNGTKTLLLSGLMYSTTYKVWVNATDPNGSNTFTKRWYTFIPRITGGGGGDGGGDGASSTETINQKPVANVSAGEPYQGFVNSPVLFDGTSSYDPNGTITTWFWMFSDTTNGTGKKINHTFSAPGTYTVTLVVIDAEGASDTDSTTCLILLPNRPPSKPIITGPVNGTTNITYNFTVVSTDEDNETIRYSVIWGDETSYANMSDFLPSGTEFSCNHRWRTPGQYTLTVTSTDNQTMSSSQLTINIETVPTLITEPTTPGFDFVFVLCAISIVLFLLRKKRRL